MAKSRRLRIQSVNRVFPLTLTLWRSRRCNEIHSWAQTFAFSDHPQPWLYWTDEAGVRTLRAWVRPPYILILPLVLAALAQAWVVLMPRSATA